jgi:hypothetical protein
MWMLASAKAKEEESRLAENQDQTKLFSQVEQIVVHGKRGVQTPNKAFDMSRETYQKDFADMDYTMFTRNMGSNTKKNKQRRELVKSLEIEKQTAVRGGNNDEARRLQKLIDENQITEADKAETLALFAHGAQKKWIDDAIWVNMLDDELKEDMAQTFGWKGTDFTLDKISDVIALFASGSDMDFAKIQHDVGRMMDVAVKKIGMSKAEFVQRLENGDLSKEQLEFMKNESGMQNLSGIIDKTTGTINKDVAELFFKKTDENQAQIQYITSIRDKMAGESHVYLGGHSEYISTADGKDRQMLIGAECARDNVFSEVNKMGIGIRTEEQSHSIMDLDEATGFGLGVREEDARISRKGVNTPNDRRNTMPRLMNHRVGLSALEDGSKYLSDKTGFQLTGKDRYGNISSRHKWAKNFVGDKYNLKKGYEDLRSNITIGGDGKISGDKYGGYFKGATLDEAERQETCDFIITEQIIPSLFASQLDEAMELAIMGGVDPWEAVKTGKINLTVLKNGKELPLSNIKELIELYNKGYFTKGEVPSRLLPQFQPGNVPLDSAQKS